MTDVKMKYLVSLDAMLDTRLGTVAKLDQKYAFELLQNQWHLRDTDGFSRLSKTFSHEDYQSSYRMRDVETLKASLMTKMHEYILSIYEDEIKQPGHGPGDISHGIYINTWPYVLDEELRNTLQEIMDELFPMMDEVALVNIPLRGLTPDFIKKNDYRAIILYELQEWLEHHYAALESCPIPQNYLIVPALLSKAIDVQSLNDELKQYHEHVGAATAFEWIHVEYIAFRLIEPVWFSMVFSDV